MTEPVCFDPFEKFNLSDHFRLPPHSVGYYDGKNLCSPLGLEMDLLRVCEVKVLTRGRSLERVVRLLGHQSVPLIEGYYAALGMLGNAKSSTFACLGA
jgi:hypothetical protein